MKLKDPILNVLGKQYEPSSMIEVRFGRYDLAFRTDDGGRPILLFIGRKTENGRIAGERYARRLKIEDGKKIKDHWEHKGKAS
ncbi:hypothetical protein SRABI27_00244 [Pedobacter sp. Bi27]|jgi:hypothetical protein|uniref:hypothetical protein n=1 Tax=unclassified Pedobacter TaxID=2628915 RepID=UPI001D28D6A5|nr:MULTISPECIES: hypothetical protein [unclassified Pedobacter]CAH0139378.1 hypothetical protein SRABI126_00251 [Pedobacter sp. Bi126]CAH0139516.1 hypothetical protein SRABI27_00244 [Pedobacter sp. Bi27]CAH0219140.1 hypothetical protein SRABI36_02430 [Pedobacter sp. Bi36]